MEPRENENNPQENQGKENPKPPQPPNINIHIYERFTTLRSRVNDLMGTKEPILLATSFDVIMRSIRSDQWKLNSISEYKARMFEFYKTRLDINLVRDLGILKNDPMSPSIDPRS